jgi:hypothetical protein
MLTGMMGTIPSDVRSGLLELFYAVYEKNPDRCIDALVTMGVLIPGNDMTAVRRTAAFFLTNFEVCWLFGGLTALKESNIGGAACLMSGCLPSCTAHHLD